MLDMGLAKKHAEDVISRGFEDSEFETVCLSCIRDDGLKEETSEYLSEDKCSFCDRTATQGEPIAAPFDDFMHIVRRGIDFLYASASDAGVPREDGDWVEVQIHDTTDVVYDVCEMAVNENVLEAIQGCVPPNDWIEGEYFFESPLDQVLRWAWTALCDKVKYSSRFVFLAEDEVSSGHPDDVTTKELLRRLSEIAVDHGAIRTVPAGTTYWRGRLAGSSPVTEDMRTASFLGSPPKTIASNSRMSPAGISFFYGSEDISTVVAEIGAHSTRQYAVVGEFETLRVLNLLDLVDLPTPLSVFASSTRRKEYYERLFLRAFAVDLAKPIELDGREHIDYVPTQVVTEYFRKISEPAVDGILFPSAQNGRANCVLFVGPDGCVTDKKAADKTGWPLGNGIEKSASLSLKSDSVKRVRIVATVANSIQ